MPEPGWVQIILVRNAHRVMAAIRGRRKVFVAPINFLEAVELDVSIAILNFIVTSSLM
jgi:hypothetical protein